MNNRLNAIKNLIKASLVTMLVTFSGVSHSANPLKEIFEVMTVSAGPTSYETQKRNGVAFGTFSARFSMYQPKVISFQPPSLSTGCGGIDFFAGSMDLVKKEELVQMARAVAAGAAVYAFNLATEAICPSCAAAMQDLQEKLEQFNELVSADCQNVVEGLSRAQKGADMAQGLKDQVEASGWHQKLSSFAATKTESYGTWVDLLTDTSPTGDPKHAPSAIMGNRMWNILGESNIDEWVFSPAWPEDETQELLMSLTGTIIVTGEAEFDYVKPSLSVQELIYGTVDDSDIKVLRCNKSESRDADGRLPCTQLIDQNGTATQWKGIYPQVIDILIGSDGLAQKMYYKRDLDDDEIALVNGASVPLMSMLFYLGKEPVAQESVAKLIAADMAFGAVDEMLSHLQNMLKISEGAQFASTSTDKGQIDFLKYSIERIHEQRKRALEQKEKDIQDTSELVDKVDKIIQKTKQMSAYGV